MTVLYIMEGLFNAWNRNSLGSVFRQRHMFDRIRGCFGLATFGPHSLPDDSTKGPLSCLLMAIKQEKTITAPKGQRHIATGSTTPPR